jgi:hypothetical protein
MPYVIPLEATVKSLFLVTVALIRLAYSRRIKT